MEQANTTALRTGLEPKKCPIRGVFFHKGSQQYISYIGYHEKTVKDKRGREEKCRVRSTQYLGSDETQAIATYFQIKATWNNVVAAERKRFEERQAWIRQHDLPVEKERFKPQWPDRHGGTEAAVQPWSQTVAQVANTMEQAKRDDPMKLTLIEGRDKYVEGYKGKVGLHNGQRLLPEQAGHCPSPVTEDGSVRPTGSNQYWACMGQQRLFALFGCRIQ